ncbi:MAG: T9SS type A sorting domain-containing protein [Bacteroidota bacterium]
MKFLFILIIFTNIYSFGYCQADLPSTTLPAASLVDTSGLLLHNFSVTEKDKKALLRWKADTLVTAEKFYAVERSSNGTDFNLVGITKTASSGWVEFLDDSPPRGRLFYRVKLSSGQLSSYSKIVSATFTADITCKFYPNPVDKVLIVRSEFSTELLISDRFGKPLITDKFPGGLKVIDVSSLEPGIYVITLFQKETGRQLSEKLVKK